MKHFHLALKILGFVFLALAIYGCVLTIRGFGDFTTHDFMIGSLLFAFGLFFGISCLVVGFRPLLMKMHTKTALHIQTENRTEMTALATNQAEIAREAVAITAQAVREGLAKDTVFCKHCGKEIAADSKYCKHCGGAQ